MHSDNPSDLTDRTDRTNLYAVLGISPRASITEIRKAYRALALRLHPDKNPSDPQKAVRAFQDVHRAYSVLSDESARSDYDLSTDFDDVHDSDAADDDGDRGGSSLFSSSFFSADCFDTRNGSGGGTGGGAAADMMACLEKLLRESLRESGGAAAARSKSKIDTDNETVHQNANEEPAQEKKEGNCEFPKDRTPSPSMVQVSLSIRDVKYGCTKEVDVFTEGECAHCGGSGFAPEAGEDLRWMRCPACSGTGERVKRVSPSVTMQTQCEACRGEGKHARCPLEGVGTAHDASCPKCKGHGVRLKHRKLQITLPPGVKDGRTHLHPKESVMVRVVHDRESFDAYRFVDPYTGDVHVDVSVDLRDVLVGGVRKRVEVMGDAYVLALGDDDNGKKAPSKKKKDQRSRASYTDPSEPVVIRGEGLPAQWSSSCSDSTSETERKNKRGDIVFHYVVRWPKRTKRTAEHDEPRNVNAVLERVERFRDVLAKIL